MLLRARSLLSFLHAFNVSQPGRPAPQPLDGAGAGQAAGAPGAACVHEASLPSGAEGRAARFRGEDGMALLSVLAG